MITDKDRRDFWLLLTVALPLTALAFAGLWSVLP